MWKSECPRSSDKSAPFSSTPHPSKAFACLGLTRYRKVTLGSWFQNGNGTLKIVPWQQKGESRAENKAFFQSPFLQLTVSWFSSQAATPSLPQTHSLQFRTAFVLCRSSSEFVFAIVFTVVVVVIVNISDSCFLWFLHGWFWETKSVAHPRLPFWDDCFLKDYFAS